MNFVLISANIIFVFTLSSNAKPMALDENRIRYVAVPQQFGGEESYDMVTDPRSATPLEVSDDDQYEETRPVAVLALPGNRQQVYRVVSNDRDLSASATDLQAAASYGGHGGGHGGWLDMGAYTSGKGAFGWYADYPVGHGGWRR